MGHMTNREVRLEIKNKLSMYGFNSSEMKFPESFEDSSYHTIFNEEAISRANFGVLLPLFKKMDIKIDAGVNQIDKKIYIKIEYDYEHHRGRNGYRVQFVFDPVVQKWEQFD